jgi:DNA polymerase elongation subunit (family B)
MRSTYACQSHSHRPFAVRHLPVAAAVQALLRALNARQFGLKMIANVSYGYTSASFSGRMPCAELADSIVAVRRCSCARG